MPTLTAPIHVPWKVCLHHWLSSLIVTIPAKTVHHQTRAHAHPATREIHLGTSIFTPITAPQAALHMDTMVTQAMPVKLVSLNALHALQQALALPVTRLEPINTSTIMIVLAHAPQDHTYQVEPIHASLAIHHV
jgi:hypothetical protein